MGHPSVTKKAELYRKLVATLLAVGGLVGLYEALRIERSMLSDGANHRSAALVGLFAFFYGASTWIGIDLWQKKPQAFTLAQVLLVAQIPIVGFPGFTYFFYTGLALYMSFSTRIDIVMGFEFQVGSGFHVQISREPDGFAWGLNLAAILALYLLGKSRTSIEFKKASLI